MHFFNLLSVLLFVSVYDGPAFGDPSDLDELKATFLHGDLSRETYLNKLVETREKYYVDGKYTVEGLKVVPIIDKEIKQYPLSPNSNSEVLSKLRVGEWESPRHDYLYRLNYTWTMLPIESGVTHGLWKIDGNRYYDWAPLYSQLKPGYTIILLDARYFVFTDGEHVVYEKRLK